MLTYNTARIFCGAFSRFRTFTLLSFRRDLKVDTIAAYSLVRCGTSEGKLRETLVTFARAAAHELGGGGGGRYTLLYGLDAAPKGMAFELKGIFFTLAGPGDLV